MNAALPESNIRTTAVIRRRRPKLKVPTVRTTQNQADDGQPNALLGSLAIILILLLSRRTRGGS